MKIVIFGLTISSSWGNGHATPLRAMLAALDRAGHRVTFYEKNLDFYALRRDLTDPAFCRLVLYADWRSVREAALRDAASADTVIVTSYCPEGAKICDEVLGLSRPLRVFYDMDTPITLERLPLGLEYLRRDQMPAFDLFLSFVGGPLLCELEGNYDVRCARPLYGCVDPTTYRRIPGQAQFACDFSYMGTYSSSRQEKLDCLFLEPARRLSGGRFVLAGTLYPWQWAWPANVRRFDHIAPAEHPAFYSSSRLTLNITRSEMARWGYCPSGRFFEAAICGCPIVSDRWSGLDEFFQPNEEVLVVDSAADVLAALRSADGELHVMAERARRRTLDEHTGSARATQLLHWIEEAAGSTRRSTLELAS